MPDPCLTGKDLFLPLVALRVGTFFFNARPLLTQFFLIILPHVPRWKDKGFCPLLSLLRLQLRVLSGKDFFMVDTTLTCKGELFDLFFPPREVVFATRFPRDLQD